MDETDAINLIKQYDDNAINVEDFVKIIRNYKVPENNTVLDETVNKDNKIKDDTHLIPIQQNLNNSVSVLMRCCESSVVMLKSWIKCVATCS